MKTFKTILVIKNRAMGDAVMGLSTIQYLKKLYPNTKVIYAVPSWVAPLFKKVETAADEIYPLSLRSFLDWPRTFFQLLRFNPDIVLELFQSGRTQKFFSIFPKNYRAHNHHLKNGPIFDHGLIKSNIQRDIDGAWTYLGKKDSSGPPSYLEYSPVMVSNEKKENAIILGVVATRETKMWSLKKYADLTHLISKEFPNAKIWIPLSPSKEDQLIEEKLKSYEISKQTEFIILPLDQLSLKISKARYYIGNDTGLKHISIALGLKTWTFFGPEPPLEWHPYSEDEHPYFFLKDLSCRTRNAHYCGLKTCETMDCLKFFDANKVWNEIKEQITF